MKRGESWRPSRNSGVDPIAATTWTIVRSYEVRRETGIRDIRNPFDVAGVFHDDFYDNW